MSKVFVNISLCWRSGCAVALDARWHAARIILEPQGLSILLILVAAARAWRDFDWTTASSWLFVSGLGAMLAGIALLYVWMQSKKLIQWPRFGS